MSSLRTDEKTWFGVMAALLLLALLAAAGVVETRSGGADGLRNPPARVAGTPARLQLPDWGDAPPGLERNALRAVDGHFVATPAARRVFDAFFAYFSWAPPALVRGRIGLHAMDSLPAGAADECLTVIDRYADLVAEERNAPNLAPADRAVLRRRMLGRDLADRLYGSELASAPLMRAAGAAAPSRAADPTIGNASGKASGNADWERRLQAYRLRRVEILADPTLDTLAREDALERERKERFSSGELARVRDFDRIESLAY